MQARPDRPLSRRAVLHSAAAVGLVVATGSLAACGTNSVAAAPPPGPDQPALDGLITDEIALIHTYQVALAAHPQLGTQVRTFLADHEAHLRALCSLAGIAVPTTPPSTPAQTSPVPAPATAAAIAAQRAALAKLESAAHGRYVTGSRRAHDGMTAAVLASAGACEAAHAALLSPGNGAAS